MSTKFKEFLRVQLSAFLGGLFDFGIYTLCFRLFDLSGVLSNVISGSLGAVVNFTINRYWSFKSDQVSLVSQLWKFVLVVLGSIALKSAGIYLLVDYYGVHYLLSKVVVELVVSLGFNYCLQRWWVFRK